MSLIPHPVVARRLEAVELAGREDSPRARRAPDPLESALELLTRERTLVVWSLFWGPRTFSELLRVREGVTKKALRHELTEMERCGLVRREVRLDATRRVDYALTAFGESVKPLVAVLYEWGLTVARPRGSFGLR
jgi:DNA-binding HxlR family transcriptional regulator